MTKEEAINILEEVKQLDDSIYQYNAKYLEALDMAIKAYENGIFIPKDATNGDVIKVMFPDFHVVETAGDTVVLHRYNPYCKMQFGKKWWNAQYMIESEEK